MQLQDSSFSSPAPDMVLYEELCDAHCHPHDDADNRALIPQLKTGHITLMGVRQDDWDTVAQVAKQCPNKKCIPAFGELKNMLREKLSTYTSAFEDYTHGFYTV